MQSTLTPPSTPATEKKSRSSQVNESALHELVGRMIGDLGAAATGSLVILGDRLGLYRALVRIGPATSEQLAEHTGLDERHLREWLACQAASQYVRYHPETASFSLSPEQAAVFADPDSPVTMIGGFYSTAAVYQDEPKIAESFRTGSGVPWSDHHACLFCGTERFFRPAYAANLIQHWIPSLDGVQEKLTNGARVADVGCGHGASTLILARAFPNSRFTGFDIHPPSIEHARRHAQEQGLANVDFAVATATDFPGRDYDLVTTFDALHDMGDPVGAARTTKSRLRPDGTWLVVEPFAGDNLEDNLNPVGRLYYAFSTMVCTPNSRSQPVGLALGAQAGEVRLAEVITGGGFSRFRRAMETPFNLILEAKP